MRARKIALGLLMFLLLLASTAGYAEKQGDIQINSFEKAYYELKDNWIFFDGHKEALDRVIKKLSIVAAELDIKNIPTPILGDGEKENMKITKKYLSSLLMAKPKQANEIAVIAIRRLVAIDFFARIQTIKKYKEEAQEWLGVYEGDGLDTNFQDKMLIVLSTFSNTPAEKAGFQTGDIILKINKISFENITDEYDFNNRCKQFQPDEFKLGKEINYEILRGNEKLTLKTKIIKIGEKEWVSYHRKGDIGVISIEQFNLGSGEQFIRALNNLKDNTRGLIVDLRGCPGGYSHEALIIIKVLTGHGYKHILTGNREIILDDDNVYFQRMNLKIVVLVSRGTASAAETLAASLRDNGAMVFGQTTWGKNFGQTVYLLPNGTMMWYSNHWIKTLKDKTWPDGIRPDFFYNNDESLIKAEEFLLEKIK